MVFSSLFFVFFFLVVSYGIYFFAKKMKTRNIILLVSSIFFYAWGGPVLVLLFCLMTFVCWIGALLIDQNTIHSLRRSLCIVTMAICIAILFIFKYAGFAMSVTYSIFGINAVALSIALPIGISFYTFQLMSYVIDVYRGEVEAQKKYWLLLLYASLFHQCIAGPIVRYADVNDEINDRTITLEDTSRGISRFAVGLAKKAILANGCGIITDAIFNKDGAMMGADGIAELSSAAVLLASLCYMLQLYLDFSAYSDMAIGMGLMVGFHYKENFNYPYIAHSATDFWRRWHMSLSTFFRDYVYIPLGGNRVSVPRHILNMFVVWALTGMWHGANWNYILWGLYWFMFLVIEKYLIKPKKEPKLLPRILGMAVTLVITFFSTMLFKFNDLSALGQAVANIFLSNGNGFSDAATDLTFKNNVFFLIGAIVACTPVIPALARLCEKNKVLNRVYTVIGTVIPVILIVISAFALAGDCYNPFLYFQF